MAARLKKVVTERGWDWNMIERHMLKIIESMHGKERARDFAMRVVDPGISYTTQAMNAVLAEYGIRWELEPLPKLKYHIGDIFAHLGGGMWSIIVNTDSNNGYSVMDFELLGKETGWPDTVADEVEYWPVDFDKRQDWHYIYCGNIVKMKPRKRR